MSGGPIRVVVVDDSRLMQGIITAALEAEGDIKVAAKAGNVAEGRRMIKETDPDAVTLDVEMPGMNGLEFLEKIMTLRPTPVVMVSSLTAEGTEITLAALQIGAVDVVRKPSGPDPMGPFGRELREKVRTAARAQVRRRAPLAAPPVPLPGDGAGKAAPPLRTGRPASSRPDPARVGQGRQPAPAPALADRPAAPPEPTRASAWKRALIAVGASTGGVGALAELLEGLPHDLPPVVITQHMPEGYTDRFARRLRDKLGRDVAEARDAEPLTSGMVRIAPGSRHLEVQIGGRRLLTRLGDSTPVTGHCPSVDVLFGSVARAAGPGAVGVILTGMGRDGAAGLRAMRGAGAATLGQSERTCVVYGMPRAARELGAVEEEHDLDRLAARICDFARSAPSRRAAPGN
ncbi:two-component system, chemotaxis family, response regulator CheB [Albimonas donghaensis]|uniref:Protein-glutamate methylesterase/protein-glutamine glutaminase n=1 Tax=Albimonas donghaensis TaxID=356660 RepID=A0A1H2X8T5_9RHOB|nr:chemotaxis response regulator protein-glutamate methylesterase [Albimonas donghaensis]SDW89313.1 two-component system, chemotaxis family, response regulator CheB [Albimonas donghaensis]